MKNLENCIALNKQGEILSACSWIIVLHGLHCDHKETPWIGLALAWRHYTQLKGPCSISESQSPKHFEFLFYF